MEINRNDLKKALEVVQPGLSNKDNGIEQSTSFAFMGDRVVTYNDEISVSHPVAGLNIRGAVKADELYALLGKLKGDKMELTQEENQITITSGRSRAEFRIEAEIKLPVDEVGKIEEWGVLPEKFLGYLKMAVPSCSNNSQRPVLGAVNVTEDGRVEASDGYRVTVCQLEAGMPVEGFLLPADSARQVINFKSEQVAQGDGWIHFQSPEGSVLSCRVMEDKFPNLGNIMKFEGAEVTWPKSLLETVERAQVFCKGKHFLEERVKIRMENRRMTISSESETAKFQEELNLNYKGAPISFTASPTLLKGALDETNLVEIAGDRIRFKGDGWVYVAMLLGDE